MSGLTFNLFRSKSPDPEKIKYARNILAKLVRNNNYFLRLNTANIIQDDEVEDVVSWVITELTQRLYLEGEIKCSCDCFCRGKINDYLKSLQSKHIVTEVVVASTFSDYYKMHNGSLLAPQLKIRKGTGEIVKGYLATNCESESGIPTVEGNGYSLPTPESLSQDIKEMLLLFSLREDEIMTYDKMHAMVMYIYDFRGYFEEYRKRLDSKVSDCFPFEMVFYEEMCREYAYDLIGTESKLESFEKRFIGFRAICKLYLDNLFDQQTAEVRYGLQRIRQLNQTHADRIIFS